jgi:hypothetical protein
VGGGRSTAVALAIGVIALVLAGCGTSATSSRAGSSHTSTEPAYVNEPFTHQQLLVEQGARLAVSYGCAACHLGAAGGGIAPSFASFAGHRVTLVDGRRVLVDEHFLRAGLLHPGDAEIKGYDPAPMLAAVRRLHLTGHPGQVAALTAFIEQIGPEPPPG